MLNGTRLARRTSWFLLAAGACLLASAAAARPAAPFRQTSTLDQPNRNQASNNNRRGQKPPKEQPKPRPSPRATPAPGRVTPRAPAQTEPDIFENIKLSIALAGDFDAPPRQITVKLWSREGSQPATSRRLDSPAKRGGLHIVNLTKGLHRNKDYWVTVTSADGRLSGEARVPSPSAHNIELPLRVDLYAAVTFEVSARGEGDGPPGEDTLSVAEKGDEASAIPHPLGPGGRASFVKGLNREAEYVLVTGNGQRFRVDPDKIEDGVLRIDLPPGGPPKETVIKVSAEPEGGPVADANVTVTFDDSQVTKTTDEHGVAVFETGARRVRAVEVDALSRESFSCGRDNEAACPEPDESWTLVIRLKDASSAGLIGSSLQWAAIVAFPLGAAAIIILGVALFRIMREPTKPPPPARVSSAGAASATGVSNTTSGVMTTAGALPAPQGGGPGGQASGVGLVQHEPALTQNRDDAGQPNRSPAVQAYSVPSSLSAEMAKEVYKRWVRREKLTRDPTRLDLELGNSTDDQSRLLKETNDPGSKFILFTDGENRGWLFPNPAPGVFETEVEQTWRLIFKDLSKEEFGRKKERLNPIEARRADGAEGRGMWTAEPKPYEFG